MTTRRRSRRPADLDPHAYLRDRAASTRWEGWLGAPTRAEITKARQHAPGQAGPSAGSRSTDGENHRRAPQPEFVRDNNTAAGIPMGEADAATRRPRVPPFSEPLLLRPNTSITKHRNAISSEAG